MFIPVFEKWSVIYTSKTNILWAFIIVIVGDLLIPYMLAPFYKGYSHRSMVMSSLGNPVSPVRMIYNIWLVLAGVIFIIGSITLYKTYADISGGLSIALLVLLIAFAVGAMILSGIFSVDETKTMTSISAKIHGFGSSFGFMALLFVPLVLAILSGKQNETFSMAIFIIFFILAFVAFVLFVMSDKEQFADTFINREGTWQRLTLLFMYCPIIYVAYQQIMGVQ